MKIKLSPAQKNVFSDLVKSGAFRCVCDYKPALKLVELGLAKGEESSYSSIVLTLTKAGKEFAETFSK